MKQQRKILSIIFLITICTIIVQAQEITNINKSSRITSTKGEYSLMDVLPSITFIDSAAVVLEYPTIASISYDTDRGFKSYAILNDLESIINPDNYNFVIMYSINEVYGGRNSGKKYDSYPKNIGYRNSHVSLSASQQAKGLWKELISMPLLNSVNWLVSYGPLKVSSTLYAFHEISHNWGAFYIDNSSVFYNTWMTNDPLGFLAGATGSHWAYNWDDNLGIGKAPGIMAWGPVSDLFNAFDLYSMGLMNYEEVKTYQYSIHDSQNNIYKVNIDDLRSLLFFRGSDYYEGDGKRIPSIDNEVKNLRSLIVIVKAKDEIFSDYQKDLVRKLAHDIPPDWNTATWGRSKMSVGIDLHSLGQPSIIAPINNSVSLKNPIQFRWSSISGASAYRIQIAVDSMFLNLAKDTVIMNTQATINLPQRATYYSRVRAENGKNNGASSKVVTFNTYTIPTLSTIPLYNIWSTYAFGGGIISDDGGISIINRGVCWSTLPNPTIKDNKTNDVSLPGAFYSTVTGLTEGITYHVRAYATNIVGTGYGEDLTFKSLVTGLHENLVQKILIYPNPAREFLTIDLEMFESKNLSFEIIDITGLIVQKESIKSIPSHYIKRLDISDNKTGTYIIKIMIDDYLYIQKFIIE